MLVSFNPTFKSRQAILEKTLQAKNNAHKVLVSVKSAKPGSFCADCITTVNDGSIVGMYSNMVNNATSKQNYMEHVDLIVDKLKKYCEDTPAIKEINDFLVEKFSK